MNNPSNLNKLCTLPPIGLADHDIVYAEIDTWLKRVRETPRKVMKYKEANWDQIKKDLENTLTTINNIYEKSDTNILWNTFKNDIINYIESNIPHKLFTYKQILPWINNNLRKLINKKNKYHRKKNQNPSMYKKLKHTVQKEQRKAYWKYIENIIFDLPFKDSDQHQYSDFKPKRLFSYFKSIRKDNSGISPLKKDGILYTDTVDKTNILNQQFNQYLHTIHHMTYLTKDLVLIL